MENKRFALRIAFFREPLVLLPFILTVSLSKHFAIACVGAMVRKLKFHEQKLLKKVDFLTWDIDNNVQEAKVIRQFQLKDREEYMA